MSFFAASPFLKALGWALVNSLWQFAVCWLLFRLLHAGMRKLTASARHTMALLLLFSGTVSFVSSLSWKYYSTGAAQPNFFTGNSTVYSSWQSANSTIDSIMPYCSLLYLVCVGLLFTKFCLFVRRAGQLQNNGVTKMSAAWRTYVKSIAARLGIQKEVKALISVHIDTPQVIGFLKPVILLPAACLVNLSTEQLEAVLLHELVHIRRNDYLVNLFVTSVEILFFFNPFVKHMTAGIRKEREYSCDDMVIQFQYRPHNYASALLTLEKNRLMPVTYGIAAGGKNQQQLLTRIERIMGIKDKQSSLYKLGASLAALLLLGFIATINPAKVAIDKFGTGGLTLADNNITALQYNDEIAGTITNKPKWPAAHKDATENTAPGKTARAASPAPVKNTGMAPGQPVLQMAEANDEDDNSIQTVSHKQTIDFSLPQKEASAVPVTEVPPEALVEEPYVPANSFSYQLTQDTAMPKIKGETYNERKAREALIKTRQAIDQINWQKIEQQLKYSKRDIAKLKKEITAQIQQLNWKQINSDVQSQMGQEQMEKWQQAIQQDHSLKLYRQNEVYNEALQRQLAEQEQLIKESGQRMEESQKAAEQQQKKLELEMKKRRVIYF